MQTRQPTTRNGWSNILLKEKLVSIIYFAFSEKKKKTPQTKVVRARHTIIWTGQDYPTGNSSRRETKRQTEETMGRQHQIAKGGLALNGIYYYGKPRTDRSGGSWL